MGVVENDEVEFELREGEDVIEAGCVSSKRNTAKKINVDERLNRHRRAREKRGRRKPSPPPRNPGNTRKKLGCQYCNPEIFARVANSWEVRDLAAEETKRCRDLAELRQHPNKQEYEPLFRY